MGVKSKIKKSGLTKRWMTNVLSVILAVLILFSVGAVLVIRQYYASTAKEFVYAQLDTAVGYFGSEATASAAAFETAARQYVESFSSHDTMEVQLLRSDGTVMMSTAGYIGDSYNKSTDYANALKSEEHTADWQGENSAGEKVLCATGLMIPKDNSAVCTGGVRIVISLAGVDRQYYMALVIVVAIVLVLFLVIVLSGVYFINSIVVPVQNISEIAGQIALGQFEVRIQPGPRQDEIRDLCTAINHMAEELASTEKMKNEFISSVSHELRTPLTAIKGWGETVQDATDDPALMQKGMSVIIGEAERLSVLVEDLLDFSRMQNGKLTYQMKPCDIVAEMAEAILTLTDNAEKKGVTLDFTEPDAFPLITGDGARLQQVFVNVVDNALKYTPQDGAVLITMTVEGDFVEVMISDNGSGIAPEDLANITQKFYKGKDAVRGSGIGLAIVEEIVSAHGGKLNIASTVKVGTTVTVTLPIHQEETK